jgi:hypothetical protein
VDTEIGQKIDNSPRYTEGGIKIKFAKNVLSNFWLEGKVSFGTLPFFIETKQFFVKSTQNGKTPQTMSNFAL